MNNQVKELLLEGYSQRAIARKLEIDRRTVAKCDKIMASSVYYKRIRKLVQSSSGFDIAKEFITAKLTIKPEIGKRELYRQVIERYPEITLGERAFNYYIDNFKSRQAAYEKLQRYIEPATSWRKRLDKNSNTSERSYCLDNKDDDANGVDVGGKIKFYREMLGLSKKELAENIGVTPPMITYYEQGKRHPSLKTIMKISKVTQVPAEYYLSDNEFLINNLSFFKENSGNEPIKSHASKTTNEIPEKENERKKSQVSNEVINKVEQLTARAAAFMNSDPDKCIELGKKALITAKDNDYNIGLGLAYTHMGLGYFHLGNYSQASKSYFTAQPIFHKEHYYRGLRSVYHNLGVVYYHWNDLEKALEYYQKSLELEPRFSCFNLTCATLNGIGTVYHQLNENIKALQYCKDALSVSIKHSYKRGISFTLSNIGKIYHALNDVEKAEYHLSKSIAFCKSINNLSGLSIAYVNLSMLKTDLNQNEAALSLLDEALKYARKLKDQFRASKVYLQFAITYAGMGKYDKQQEHLHNCIKLAQPNEFRSTALSAYTMLVGLYEKKTDYQNALRYYKKIQKIKDFLNNEKKTRAIEEIKTKLEVERTEKEKRLLHRKNTELHYKNEQIMLQKKKLEKAEKKLTELNHNLELKVKKEVKKRRQQEQIIMQKSKLESLGRLAAGVAHEINQPVGLIHMAAQNLCHKFENDKITAAYLTKKTNFIYENIDRINKIIEHLRLFSRDQKRRKEKVNVVKTLEDSLLLTTTQFRSHNINIIKDIQSEVSLTMGNKYQLEQVIINLLSNAKDALDSKYGKYDKGKQIILRVKSNCKKINIEIEDNGCGVDKETARHVFDPFFTTKKEEEGTGLGLSISYGIINDMNGKITVDSVKDKFTVFKIELPVHNE